MIRANRVISANLRIDSPESGHPLLWGVEGLLALLGPRFFFLLTLACFEADFGEGNAKKPRSVQRCTLH